MLSVGVALLGASVVLAADKPATCSQTSKCPKETPCCSRKCCNLQLACHMCAAWYTNGLPTCVEFV